MFSPAQFSLWYGGLFVKETPLEDTAEVLPLAVYRPNSERVVIDSVYSRHSHYLPVKAANNLPQ
mgnify:CR=1 FL=1